MEFDHSTDTISPDDQSVVTIGGTGGLVVPVGTTAQRPGSPTLATVRWNNETSTLEVFNASSVWGTAAPSGISQLARYRAITNDQAATDPGLGNLKWNNATLSSATSLYIDALTDGGFDTTNYINAVNVPFILFIQEQDDASVFQRWTVSAKANNTGWFTFTVTYIDGAGTFGNNDRIALAFQNNPAGGAGTVTSVTLTQPAAGLTLTNSGVSQTPTVTSTFALANDLAAVEGLATTGIVRRTGTDAWSAGTAVGLTTEVTGILPGANGGTNNAFMAFTGPATSLKTYTLPNATTTILTTNAAVTAAQGGTGNATYAIGDLLQASASTTLTRLASVATGNVLISGGVTTVSSWGKVGLSTHVSGNLPVTNLNSGTGASGTTFWCGDGTWATPSGASPLPNATILGVTSAANSITGIAGASSAAPMTLIAGFASGGTGNDITVSGGATASGQGGTAIITGGTAGGSNDGGNLLLKSGDTSGTGLGGSITMHADSIYKGGNITIRAGNSPGNNVAGGDLSLAAGHSQNGSTSNRGGNITITAGDSITAGNPAGNVTISSGITTAGTGGYLVFQTGSTAITERFRILANGAWSVGSAGNNTGTATQVLTSNGSGSPPTWQAAGGGGSVSSVTGTSNQVTVSPTTGATVVSLPSTIIAPGTVQATGSFISNTASSSLTSTTGTALSITTGAAANATSPGSNLTITASDGGVTSGSGGVISVTAGSGITSGQGGNVTIFAGSGGFTSGGGGVMALAAGSANNNGAGGTMQIDGGAAAGTNQAGGSVTITAGSSTGTIAGGAMLLRGGAGGGGGGAGGAITVRGGETFTSGGTSGQAIIESGNQGISGNSGSVLIQSGTVTDGNAGTVFITGRNGIGTNRSGGSVTINSGSSTGTGVTGDISLLCGSLLGAGTPGKVTITGGSGTGSTIGGGVFITAGNGGTTGTGAITDIKGGPGGTTSGAGGIAQFTGGTPVDGVGGAAQFQGGPGVGTNRAGGQCLILGGAGTGTASGGLASVQAGATVTGTGGIAYLTGGGGGTTGTGGDISITSGAGGSTSGPAGNVFMVGGTPVNGNGGTINITGSNGVGTNRNGGNVVISAGTRTGSGTAGLINLIIPSPGTLQINGASGTAGHVLVSGGASAPPTWAAAGAAGAGGSTTQIQYNNAGVLAGDADLVWDASTNTMTLGGTDTGIVLAGITTDPAASPAGTGRFYAKSDAGRILPRWIGPAGLDVFLQATLAKNNVRMWKGGSGVGNTAIASTSAAQIIGSMQYTSLAGGGVTTPTLATTNLKTQTSRSVITNTNAAGNLAYIRGNALQVTRGNAAGIGGYYVVIRFGLSATGTNNRAFAGLQDTAANPTNVDPTTTTTPGKIGMAINANTGNWNLIHNVTGTAPTIIGLGANFPVNTTHLWELTLFCGANASGVGYRVANLSTGNVTSGTISTNQPANTTFLTPSVWITNNATAGVLGIDFVSAYVETDF